MLGLLAISKIVGFTIVIFNCGTDSVLERALGSGDVGGEVGRYLHGKQGGDVQLVK